jgi:hypothetical protein
VHCFGVADEVNFSCHSWFVCGGSEEKQENSMLVFGEFYKEYRQIVACAIRFRMASCKPLWRLVELFTTPEIDCQQLCIEVLFVISSKILPANNKF